MDEHDANHDGSGACRMCLAIPGKIIEVTTDDRSTVLVDIMGVRRRVDLGLLAENAPVAGDWVLIHVGFAMSKISETDAQEQMRLLSMLGEAEAAFQEVTGYGLDDSPPTSQSKAGAHTGGS